MRGHPFCEPSAGVYRLAFRATTNNGAIISRAFAARIPQFRAALLSSRARFPTHARKNISDFSQANSARDFCSASSGNPDECSVSEGLRSSARARECATTAKSCASQVEMQLTHLLLVGYAMSPLRLMFFSNEKVSPYRFPCSAAADRKEVSN